MPALKREFSGPKRQTLSSSICMAVSAEKSSANITRGSWPALRMPRTPRLYMPKVGSSNSASKCGLVSRIACSTSSEVVNWAGSMV